MVDTRNEDIIEEAAPKNVKAPRQKRSPKKAKAVDVNATNNGNSTTNNTTNNRGDLQQDNRSANNRNRNNRQVRSRRSRTQNQQLRTKAGDKNELVPIEHEPNDGADGIMKLKISNARPRIVYTRLARLFLAGFDNKGDALDTIQPVDKVEIAALGAAVTSAIYIADNLTKNNVCETVSVFTEFLPIEHADGVTRGSPRIVILLKKAEGWNAQEDTLLKKSRVYRQKVLNMEEDQEAGDEETRAHSG